MATDFRQIDSGNPISSATPFCADGIAAPTMISFDAAEGGSPGEVEIITILGTPNGVVDWLGFVCGMRPGDQFTEWAAGDYTIRIYVLTTHASAKWRGTWLCRLDDSDNVLETLGSTQDQNISLSTGGVKSMTVSGAYVGAPAVDDKIVAVMQFRSTIAAHANIGIVPNQLISTPLSLPASSFIVPQAQYHYRRRRSR